MTARFPTYDSPRGPVRDFISYLNEDDSPVQSRPLSDAIRQAHESIADGGDFLCDMGDGRGARFASEILKEIEDPASRERLFESIAENVKLQIIAVRERNQWPLH